jgi:hypothetical protein
VFGAMLGNTGAWSRRRLRAAAFRGMLAAMKAAVLSIALAACGAGQPAAPPVSNRTAAVPADAAVDVALMGGAAAIAKLQQLADDMCKCPDRDCAEQVVDEMSRWAQDLASHDAAPKVNMAQDEQARAATDRMSKCMIQVYQRRSGSGAGSGAGSNSGAGAGSSSGTGAGSSSGSGATSP